VIEIKFGRMHEWRKKLANMILLTPYTTSYRLGRMKHRHMDTNQTYNYTITQYGVN